MQSKAPDVGEVPLHELLAEVLAGDPADGGFEMGRASCMRGRSDGSEWGRRGNRRWQHCCSAKKNNGNSCAFISSATDIGIW
jgi:hypothetical protein